MTLIRKLIAVPIAVLAALLLLPAVALAQDEVAPVAVEGAGDTFVLSPFIWKTITAIVLPIVIYLVTKASGSPTFKVILAFVVAAVDALVIRWTALDGSMLFDQAALQDIFHVYGIQMLAYWGINKTNLPSKLAPNSGIG